MLNFKMNVLLVLTLLVFLCLMRIPIFKKHNLLKGLLSVILSVLFFDIVYVVTYVPDVTIEGHQTPLVLLVPIPFVLVYLLAYCLVQWIVKKHKSDSATEDNAQQPQIVLANIEKLGFALMFLATVIFPLVICSCFSTWYGSMIMMILPVIAFYCLSKIPFLCKNTWLNGLISSLVYVIENIIYGVGTEGTSFFATSSPMEAYTVDVTTGMTEYSASITIYSILATILGSVLLALIPFVLFIVLYYCVRFVSNKVYCTNILTECGLENLKQYQFSNQIIGTSVFALTLFVFAYSTAHFSFAWLNLAGILVALFIFVGLTRTALFAKCKWLAALIAELGLVALTNYNSIEGWFTNSVTLKNAFFNDQFESASYYAYPPIGLLIGFATFLILDIVVTLTYKRLKTTSSSEQ